VPLSRFKCDTSLAPSLGTFCCLRSVHNTIASSNKAFTVTLRASSIKLLSYDKLPKQVAFLFKFLVTVLDESPTTDSLGRSPQWTRNVKNMLKRTPTPGHYSTGQLSHITWENNNKIQALAVRCLYSFKFHPHQSPAFNHCKEFARIFQNCTKFTTCRMLQHFSKWAFLGIPLRYYAGQLMKS